MIREINIIMDIFTLTLVTIVCRHIYKYNTTIVRLYNINLDFSREIIIILFAKKGKSVNRDNLCK